MKANIQFDKNNYIKWFQTDNLNGEYIIDDETFEFNFLFCYYLDNGNLKLDEVKKQKQIKEEEEEELKLTWQEIIDSQVFYTAMMTDTLIEEE